jgi:hypothetical protein
MLAIGERLVVNFPTVPEFRDDLAAGHNNLGTLLKRLKRRDDVQIQYRKGIEIREKLASEFTAVPD